MDIETFKKANRFYRRAEEAERIMSEINPALYRLTGVNLEVSKNRNSYPVVLPYDKKLFEAIGELVIDYYREIIEECETEMSKL